LLSATVGFFLCILCAVLVVVGATMFAIGRQRTQRALKRSLDLVACLEDERDELRGAIEALVERHLPPDKKPESCSEAVIALDGICCMQVEQNTVLHRRLLDAIRTEHEMNVEIERLKQQNLELERLAPSREFRAGHAAVCRERDELKVKVEQLSALIRSEPDREVLGRVNALTRQNQGLRGDLGNARRLITALERQLQTLEQEQEIFELPDDHVIPLPLRYGIAGLVSDPSELSTR
jgi:hypothetical protein